MRRSLEQPVVVITGASSGIGRETALTFARRGASVVLAARREDALKRVAAECEGAGGRALPVPTDVRDGDAVDELARRTVEAYERLDVWVNNAGVSLFGRFDETPPDLYRAVLETNFFGYVHGARAALPRFREQGEGLLVNNASMNARVPGPYISAYVASKWAIRGWSESLRQELRDEPGIHVAVVLPASIDTPFFQHVANHTGRRVKPLRPVNPPEKVAHAIVSLAEKPRREILVGKGARMLALQHALAPAVAERAFAAQVEHDHFADEPAAPSAGNVLEPMPEWTASTGGWQNGAPSSVRRAGIAAAAVLPAIVAGLSLARARR